MLKIGVLASGKGTNLQAIIDAIRRKEVPAEIGIVLSDNPDAYALERVKKAGIRALYLPAGRFKTYLEERIEKNYINVLKKEGVELVCLAGFMRVLKRDLLNAFAGRIINIHPALLPSFPGLESWKQALNYGVKFTGATVHFVEEGIDSGPIILQAVVPTKPDDTPETLHRRIQEKEHIIYPLAIKLIAENRLRIEGRRVNIEGSGLNICCE
ncbi:MAG: phosphoribosylglycinamide formyltransferase [Candidatus Omnitrophica bacterium]|nr:phosphoribosylglycinamide formyltransferase [Candidatus Omnitrophota bacterium]